MFLLFQRINYKDDWSHTTIDLEMCRQFYITFKTWLIIILERKLSKWKINNLLLALYVYLLESGDRRQSKSWL